MLIEQVFNLGINKWTTFDVPGKVPFKQGKQKTNEVVHGYKISKIRVRGTEMALERLTRTWLTTL